MNKMLINGIGSVRLLVDQSTANRCRELSVATSGPIHGGEHVDDVWALLPPVNLSTVMRMLMWCGRQ